MVVAKEQDSRPNSYNNNNFNNNPKNKLTFKGFLFFAVLIFLIGLAFTFYF